MRNYVSTNSTNNPSTYVGTKGEITVDPATSQLRVHDGNTLGGLSISASGSSDRLVNGSYEAVLDADGNITLPQGTTIRETANTTVITPPGASAGQSLVIRLTGAQGITSDHPGGFTDGDTITITVTPDYNFTSVTGTVDYTFTGATSQQLGRALTGTLTFNNEGAKPISWTIPISSTMTTFTITLSNASGFDISGIAPLTLTRSGSSEDYHVHLIAGDPSITDIYLGDDDQYVKIEKNGGAVVIGTNTNTNYWTFGTDGTTTLPGAVVKSTVAKTGGGIGAGTALDLTKSVNKLTTGEYTLANGVEGQIMYLVGQTGVAAVMVTVANARIEGVMQTDLTFSPFTDGTNPTNMAALIFTDSAWQNMGGVWSLT
jgi:hypothetical protein